MPRPRSSSRSAVRHICFCAVLLVNFSLPGPAVSDSGVLDGIEALKASYKSGNAAAAYQLGSAYQFGRGVWKNQREAVRWYRLGARRGDDQAALALADAYLSGEGTPRSEEKAVYWYFKVGASDSAYARPARTRLLTLTRSYVFGENGANPSPARARELFNLILKMEQEGQARVLVSFEPNKEP